MSTTRRKFSFAATAAMLMPRVARAAATPIPLITTITGDTRAACEGAIRDGADFVAVRIVVTRDGVLIVAADNELSLTTDIAQRDEFAKRRATKRIDASPQSGWFAEDFSLAELKTLGSIPTAKSRQPAGPHGGILTLDEVIDLARTGCIRQARVIGIYARLLHPTYFSRLGLALEPRVANTIRSTGYDSPAAAMFVESTEESALKILTTLTRVRRVRNVSADSDLTLASLRLVRASAQSLSIREIGLERHPNLVTEAHSVGLSLLLDSDTSDRHRLETLCRTKPDSIISPYTLLATKARNAASARWRSEA